MSAAVAMPSQFDLGHSKQELHQRKQFSTSSTSTSEANRNEFADPAEEEFVECVECRGAISGTNAAESPPMINGKKVRNDKFAFVLGVAHFWICAYWLGSFPSTFYKLYTLEALVLFPLRWKSFKKMKMHYYMFDFCYGANLLLIAFLWFLPRSNYLMKVSFAFNSGPLAWSIVLFKNSLVYHSLAEVTTLFMHWSPMLVSWSLRWYPDCHSNPCQIINPNASLFEAEIVDMLLWPMIPYLLWAVFYYLKIFVISSKKIRERDYHTLYRYMIENGDFEILKNIVFRFSAKWQPFAYMCIHLCLVWLSLLTAVIWWNSFWAHTTWVTIATLCSAWNGAAYYFT